jgi:hypothetical protein
MVNLYGPPAPDKKGRPAEVIRYCLRLNDGRFSIHEGEGGTFEPRGEVLTRVGPEREQMTPIELAVAEAQRTAVVRFPELAVAGSKLNAAYVARLKTYQDQRADYFRDTSWPMRLAEEVAASVSGK